MNYDAALSLANEVAMAFKGGDTPADSAPCLENAAAPDRSGLIVLVFDTMNDEPVSGARVTLANVSGNPLVIAPCLTDANGLARFLPVQPLNFTLSLQDLPARLAGANGASQTRNVPPGNCPVHVFTLPIIPRLEFLTLTEWFDPAAQRCVVRYRSNGLAGHGELEVHATAYFEEIVPGPSTVAVERPCRTEHPIAPADPCVYHADAGLLAEAGTLEWNGDSQAQRGVHAAAHKINARCAPYTVMLRHYRDAADRQAGITLDPFYVRWQLRSDNTWVIDPASCRVSWRLHGDNASRVKLRAGRILVHDHSGATVHDAPLTPQHLDHGGVDLTADLGWKTASMTRQQMPFRVQVQLHTDASQFGSLASSYIRTPASQTGWRWRPCIRRCRATIIDGSSPSDSILRTAGRRHRRVFEPIAARPTTRRIWHAAATS